MTTIAKLSNGTLLKIDDGASTYTTVPEVMKLSGPGVKFDLLDVSSHDTSTLFRGFIPGVSAGDAVRFEINWRPPNTIHKQIRTDAYAATLRNFKIVFPDSSFNTVTMATYIQSFSPNADVGKQMTAVGDLKIT